MAGLSKAAQKAQHHADLEAARQQRAKLEREASVLEASIATMKPDKQGDARVKVAQLRAQALAIKVRK